MAVAETSDVWHRSVNHCFVKEDTKSAPKLVDAGQFSAALESDHAAINVADFNRKSSFSNLASDSRWWLMQHNNGFRKGLTYDKLNALGDEVGILSASDENEEDEGYYKQFGDANDDSVDYIQRHFQVDITKKTKKDRMQEAHCENSQAFREIIDMMSKQTKDFSLDSDYSWIEGHKAEPWWRTTDRNELAFFVSQKSVNHIENCDLPPPQKKYLTNQPCRDISDDKIKTTSFDSEAKSSDFLNRGHLYFASGKSSSEGFTEQVFEVDPSKAQLIEALCHSQTRAREAEELAKQVYTEKEHIIALFFKQASELFAYKQWFRLLQLETQHIHIKNKDHPKTPFEGRKLRKRKRKFGNTKQERQTKPKSDVTTTYAVAFALGMGLVGAGLLLGWTIGPMLPRP